MRRKILVSQDIYVVYLLLAFSINAHTKVQIFVFVVKFWSLTKFHNDIAVLAKSSPLRITRDIGQISLAARQIF